MGPLTKSKRKDELEDLAVALALPESSKNDELFERISEHLKGNSALKEDQQFESLLIHNLKSVLAPPTHP